MNISGRSLNSSGDSSMSNSSSMSSLSSLSSISMSSNSNSTTSSGINSIAMDDEELKKKKIRQMQNRQSAAQYRERKKEYLEKLESVVDGLESDRNHLLLQTKQLNMLQSENAIKISFLEKQIEAALTENRDLKTQITQLSKTMDTGSVGSSSSSSTPTGLSPSPLSTFTPMDLQQQQQFQQQRKSRFNIGENRNILNPISNLDQNQSNNNNNNNVYSNNSPKDFEMETIEKYKISDMNSNNSNISHLINNDNQQFNTMYSNGNGGIGNHFKTSISNQQPLQKRQRDNLSSLLSQDMLINGGNGIGGGGNQSSSAPLPSYISSPSFHNTPPLHNLLNNNTSFTPPLASFSSILSIASPTSSPLMSSSPNFNSFDNQPNNNAFNHQNSINNGMNSNFNTTTGFPDNLSTNSPNHRRSLKSFHQNTK